MKEAYSGDAGRTSGNAVLSICLRHSAQGEDGEGGGSLTGSLQAVDTYRGHDYVTVDCFPKDRGEEDCIGMVSYRDLDLGQRVAGDANERTGEAVQGVAATRLFGQDDGGRRQVNAVGLALDRCAQTAVYQQTRRGVGGDGLEDRLRDVGEFKRAEVFLAELDEVDRLFPPSLRLSDEGGAFLGLIAGEE